MQTNNITITPAIENTLEALQRRNGVGTYEAYDSHLARIFNTILYQGDDLGMDDTETVDTLRALALLRADLAVLACRTKDSAPDMADATDPGRAYDNDGGAPTESVRILEKEADGDDPDEAE